MRKLIISLLLVITLLTVNALAGEVSSNFDFTVNLTSGCMITNSTGLTINYSVMSQGATGSFSVNHVCTQGTDYTMTVSEGQNAYEGLRRAVRGGDYVKYRLYWDSNHTDEIGVTSNNSKQGTGTGAQTNATIYAKVLKTDNDGELPYGAYTDTLRFTLSW